MDKRILETILADQAEELALRGCLIISVKAQAKKFEMDLSLRRRSIAVAM